MVELIHDGRKESDAPRVAGCRKCGSTFRFKPSEGRKVYDDRDGNAIVIGCPACGDEVWLSEAAHALRMRSVFG